MAFDLSDGVGSGEIRKRGKEMSDGRARAGIAEIGSDFSEGDEDECALGEAGVRDFEAGLGDYEIAIEKKVEVDGAGAVRNGRGAVSAEVALDGEERVEEIARKERCFESNDGVEEAGLGRQSDRLGGVQRGASGDAAKGVEALGGGGERGVRRAGRAGEIGAECDVGKGHAGSRVAELAVFPTPP
jgi:hypothetical protein